MRKKFFFSAVISFLLVGSLCGRSFCSLSEDEVVNLYKSYLREKNACANYDDYARVNNKYASQGKLARARLPKMGNASEGLKQSIFGVVQATMFSVSELEIQKVEIKDGLATVYYTRKSHPELAGQVIIVKEAGAWRIDQDTLKTK